MSSPDQIYAIVKKGGPPLARIVDVMFPTRKAFATEAMISVSDASRFCNGKRKPPEHVIPQICAALGVDLPKIEIPKDSIEKAARRMIRSLENALTLERERSRQLEHQVATLAGENRDLSAKLRKIRELCV